MTKLTSLIYASQVTPGYLNSVEINKILAVAREKNKTKQLTGMLLCNLHYFLQILEGPKQILSDTYSIIEQDSRHQNVTKISESITESRQFPDWQMGFYLFPKNKTDVLPEDWTLLSVSDAQWIFSRALNSCEGAGKAFYEL